MRLQGRTALISGAAHGIGYATARRFASEGAAVVIADIDEKRGDRAARQIEDDGGRARFVAVDITDHAQVDALIDLTLRERGSLDVLHNNAYVLGAGRAGELSVEDWQRTIDVCLTAYWYCTKAALGPMVAQGKGVIINSASVAALAADHTLTAYSAAKAGVVNLTRAVAIDYARKGIRCNAICPGPVWTHSQAVFDALPDDVSGPMVGGVPMGRLGRPEELANLALFLASDESSFMTGAICVADGGLFAHTGMPALAGTGPSW